MGATTHVGINALDAYYPNRPGVVIWQATAPHLKCNNQTEVRIQQAQPSPPQPRVCLPSRLQDPPLQAPAPPLELGLGSSHSHSAQGLPPDQQSLRGCPVQWYFADGPTPCNRRGKKTEGPFPLVSWERELRRILLTNIILCLRVSTETAKARVVNLYQPKGQIQFQKCFLRGNIPGVGRAKEWDTK